MISVATWDDVNANLSKTPTEYKDFTYDTITDGGILTKLDEVVVERRDMLIRSIFDFKCF